MVVQLAFDDGAAIVDALALPDLRPLAARAYANDGRRARALGRSEDLRRPIRPRAAASLRYASGRRVSRLRHAGLACRFGTRRLRCAAGEIADRQRLVGASVLRAPQIEYLVGRRRTFVAALRCAASGAREARTLRVGLRGVCRSSATSSVTASTNGARTCASREPSRMSRRELGILNELVKLRDRIARERDLPVRYILPDDVVAGLATP